MAKVSPYPSMIRNFHAGQKISPWRLNDLELATKLLHILDNPDVVNQNPFGFCGHVVFLRAWLYHDPYTVFTFANDLYENGKSSIKNKQTGAVYPVQAGRDLLLNDYIKDNPDSPATSAVWMICSALQNEIDEPGNLFDGSIADGGKVYTVDSAVFGSELATWLHATGAYDLLENNLAIFNKTTGAIVTFFIDLLTGLPIPWFADARTIDDACKLDPLPGPNGQTDVFLCVDGHLFDQLTSSVPQIPTGELQWYDSIISGLSFTSHWLMLEDKITPLGNDEFSVPIWTWGRKYTIVVKRDVFNANYLGAIKAHSTTCRRTTTPMPLNPADSFKGGVEAWYSQQNTLEIEWTNENDYVEWFTIMDKYLFSSSVAEGAWDKITTGHTLVPLSDRILDWHKEQNIYYFSLWWYDLSNTDDIFVDEIALDSWVSVTSEPAFVPLNDGTELLVWTPADGKWKLWSYDDHNPEALFSGAPLVQSQFSSITAGHRLLWMRGGMVLDWVPANGTWRLWELVDPAARTTSLFKDPPFAQGTWPTIGNGHELIHMKYGKVLDVDTNNDTWRLWNYQRDRYHPVNYPDIFDEDPDMKGEGSGSVVQLPDERLLQWAPVRPPGALHKASLWQVFDYAALIGHVWQGDCKTRNGLQSYHFSVPAPGNPYRRIYAIEACDWWNDISDVSPSVVSGSDLKPKTRTDTQNFQISYFVSDSDDQIRDGYDQSGDFDVASAGGRILGHKYSDGGMEMNGNYPDGQIIAKKMISIDKESNTPDYVARIAISLEYCRCWLEQFLSTFPRAGEKIDIVIQKKVEPAVLNSATGRYGLQFDPQLSDEEISLAALNGLIDIVELDVMIPQIKGNNFWDIPPRSLLQDFILGSNNLGPLLTTFMNNPKMGLSTPEGAAVIWAYLADIYSVWNQCKVTYPPGFADLLPAESIDFVYSDQHKDIYVDNSVLSDLVLCTAGQLAKAPGNRGFGFFNYATPAPPCTSAMLTANTPARFTDTLIEAGSMTFHTLVLEPGTGSVAIDFQASPSSAPCLLHIILLDANNAVLDIISTDQNWLNRAVGLLNRGGTVTKLLFAIAYRANSRSVGLTYSIQAYAMTSACDIMVTRWNRQPGKESLIVLFLSRWDNPDIYLTTLHKNYPNDVVDINDDTNKSIVHVRLHNHGNVSGHVTVKLYYSPAIGSDTSWKKMDLEQSAVGCTVNGSKDLEVDVPGASSTEFSATWFCPLFRHDMKVKHGISIAVELSCGADQSPDNDRGLKNHAWTNGGLPDDSRLELSWPTAEIQKWWFFPVDVEFDGENIYEHGVQLARAVNTSARYQEESGLQLNVQINEKQLVETRASSKKTWRIPALYPTKWKSSLRKRVKHLPLVFSSIIKGQRRVGFSMDIPRARQGQG